MVYRLEDLIDKPLLQSLQEKLNVIYSFPSAIIDNDGKVLTAVAWQDICTKFYRTNPECEKECIKSDQYILEHLHEANPAVSYQCPHGLVDNAIPIIVDGKHLGNFFTGQFFLEKPDLKFLKQQAKKYGFDEKTYLEAVEKVPIWTKEKLAHYLDFIKGFIEIIAGLGLKNLKEIETRKIVREYEERLRFYTDNSPLAVVEWDSDFIVTRWTSDSEKIFGWSAEEAIGKPIMDLNMIFESDIPIVLKTMEKLTSGLKKHVVSTNRNYRKDGSIIACEWYNTILMDENEKMLSVLSQVLDITERVKGEEYLFESEKLYRSLFENMLNSFAYCQMHYDENYRPWDFTYLAVNKAFETQTGLRNVIGKKVTELIPDFREFDTELIEIYGQVSKTGEPKHFEIFLNSLQMWCSVSVYCPRLGYFVAVFDNINERKQAEEEIKSIKESLMLLNHRFEENSENERKLISHEIHDQLGQALTALKIDINWLKRKFPSDSEEGTKIQGIVELLTSTTKDVQRISSELHPAMLEDIGLDATIEWYCEEFDKRMGIKCQLKLDEIKSVDEKKGLALYRVLQEALINVARHANAKNVNINLYQADDSVIMEVIDDGIGIKKEKINSYKSIGLIGMRERIKKFNGNMDISSTLNKGTKLTVSIPLN